MPGASGSLRGDAVRGRRRPGVDRRRPRRHAAGAHRRPARDRGREDHHGGHRPLPAGRPRPGLDAGADRACRRSRWCRPAPWRTPRSRWPPPTRSPSRWRPAAPARAWSASRAPAGAPPRGCSTASSPKYKSLLPAESASVATVETAGLVESVRRVALVAERNTPIRLSFSAGEVTLEAGSRRRGAGLGVARRAASPATTSRSPSTRRTCWTGSGRWTRPTPSSGSPPPPGRRCSPARTTRGRDRRRRLPLPAHAGPPLRLRRQRGPCDDRRDRRKAACTMEIGLVGLGKMGGNMRERLRRAGHTVVGYDRNQDISDAKDLADMVQQLPVAQGRLGDGAGRRHHPADRRGAGRAARRGRRRRRRRQLALDRRQGPRRDARRARHRLRRRRRLRRRLGPGERLRADGRRRRRRTSRRSSRSSTPSSPRATRGLRARRPGRRRPLREDGAQRHRVRPDAGLRRGLRAAEAGERRRGRARVSSSPGRTAR